MAIKNIVFDLGDVLVYPKSLHWFITPRFYEILNKEYIDENKLKKSFRDNMYVLTQNPNTEEEEYNEFRNFYFKVLSDIRYPNINQELADKVTYDCVYNDDKFIFYDDVNDNLERLSKKYNLYILSNAWPSIIRILKKHGIEKHFKGIVVSFMYSTLKEEKLFDSFIEEYKIKTKDSVFVDDRKDLLKIASELGFEVLLMDRNNNISSEEYKSINKLEELD